jgi:hypothetical protein
MSWSIATAIVPKSAIEQTIEDLFVGVPDLPTHPHVIDQLETAKRGALEILKSVPGPYMSVSMAGHSNGVGWQKKEGYANEVISVTVTQHIEVPE